MGESASTDHVQRVERELAKEDSLLANMIEQAPGMIGMALMFIVTIVLGIWLQPWFDAAGLQAFGESGSTEVRWIALELVAIFAFTFMILWLAKNNLQHFIKYGILFVLFLALCYTTVPGAHILLVPEIETEEFVFTESEEIQEELFAVNSDGSIITHKTVYGDNVSNHTLQVSKRSLNTSLEWNTSLNSFPGSPDFFSVSEGEFGFTVNNDAWIWTLNKEDGSVMSKYSCFDVTQWNGTFEIPLNQDLGPCVSALEVIEDPDADPGQLKGAVYVLTSKNTIVRLNTFEGEFVQSNYTEDTGFYRKAAEWVYPFIDVNQKSLVNRQYNANTWLVGTTTGVVMIELEENSDSYGGMGVQPPGWYDEAAVGWLHVAENNNPISAISMVTSPWDDDEILSMIGYEDGEIEAWLVDDDGDGNFTEEDRFKGGDYFSGPIVFIANYDIDQANGDEIWIADGKGIHGLFYESMIEYVTIEKEVSPNSTFIVDGYDIKTTEEGGIINVGLNAKGIVVSSGEFDPDTMYNSYGIQWDTTALLVGVGLAVLLMAALIIKPEWYIVNTVGVLVGAGVIVMLGVTFVPTLIVIFMVLAAIYDAWAVYRSKHMLELADTMIGLNLPILLVAPQESGYSMLEDKDSINPEKHEQNIQPKVSPSEDKPKQIVKRKKPKEAMFMGLGDVIFPGMLVISCVNSVPDEGLAVGISALIGGLIGYFVLMTYVASGRPQAGLPLLNGGAILGYIVGGLLFVGSAAFSFGISF